MIRFLHSRGHSYTFKKVRRSSEAPPITLMNYDRLLRARWLRRGTYVFTDVDRLSSWDLELASQAYLQLKNTGVSVLNNPATVKTRYPLLRALRTAGLNDFNVYRVAELNDAVRFPVFLRKIYGHREPLSDLLQTRGQLDEAIATAANAGTPVENLLVVEFAAEPVREGLYRKLAAFRIGDAIVPHSSVHDTNWLVKYGKLGIAGDELYREELEFLQTNPFAEHLKKVFELANIEYGRADFGFYKGRIQVYEINTNPYVAPGEPHPSPVRGQSMRVGWEKYLAALRAIDSGGGWPVRLPNGKLQRHRPWKNLLTHTRKVP
jgi:hypothetical protein